MPGARQATRSGRGLKQPVGPYGRDFFTVVSRERALPAGADGPWQPGAG